MAEKDPLIRLIRYGFYLSVLLLFYGTLFPFHFDFSLRGISAAWAQTGLVPYWNVERGRIHNLPDMVANVLLTLPLGFFGYLWFGRNKKRSGIARWFAVGFVLGFVSEIVQLVVPSRISDITDALNNGLGAFLGAFAASLYGAKIFDLFSGSLFDKKKTCFLILLGIVIATMLLPFDFGLDVSQIKSSVRRLLLNPWESGMPIEDEWIHMVEFAMMGALAGSIKQRRLTALAILLPFVLEPAQVIVEFHSPSLRDLVMNSAGVFSGLIAARYFPTLVHPRVGFILMNLAILAQGLSPYRFVGWSARSHFNWVPLIEYYYQTTGAALYDAMFGLLSYGLLVALWPKRTTIVWAVLLSGGIEVAQVVIPARFSGTTDILIAAIGAWAGYSLSKALSHAYQKR